jgi:hypothetical protein
VQFKILARYLPQSRNYSRQKNQWATPPQAYTASPAARMFREATRSGVSGAAAFDVRLSLSVVFGNMAAAWARVAGVDRRNRDDTASGPTHLILQLSPVFGPGLIQNCLIEASFLLDVAARLGERASRRARHVGHLQVFDRDQTVGQSVRSSPFLLHQGTEVASRQHSIHSASLPRSERSAHRLYPAHEEGNSAAALFVSGCPVHRFPMLRHSRD